MSRRPSSLTQCIFVSTRLRRWYSLHLRHKARPRYLWMPAEGGFRPRVYENPALPRRRVLFFYLTIMKENSRELTHSSALHRKFLLEQRRRRLFRHSLGIKLSIESAPMPDAASPKQISAPHRSERPHHCQFKSSSKAGLLKRSSWRLNLRRFGNYTGTIEKK